MSSIIKSQRVRNESVIDFSARQITELDDLQEDELEVVSGALLKNETDLSTTDHNEGELGTTNSNSEVEQLEDDYRTKEDIQKYKRKQLHEIQELIDLKLREADENINRMHTEMVLKTKKEQVELENTKKAILFEAEVGKQKILDDAKKQADIIIEKAIEEKRDLLINSEDEMVKTIAYLVETIVSDELNYETRWIKMLIKKMLYKDELIGEISIKISPNLYSRLSDTEIDAILTLKDCVKITQDEMINETSCIISCEQGIIKYDVSDGIKRVLQDVRILLETK